jgi:DNA-binding NtrC family response regulator
MTQAAIVVVEERTVVRQRVRERLVQHGYTVVAVPEAARLAYVLRMHQPTLVIIGALHDDVWESVKMAEQLRMQHPQLPLMLLMSQSTEALAIAALKAGVTDYFAPPLALDALVSSIDRCLVTQPRRSAGLERPLEETEHLEREYLVGESQPMQAVKAYLDKVALTDSNVLITGETGTGKELVATLIHQKSPRRHKPFVCVNCAAIPDSLLESELFGYERGAFTGAQTAKEGLLQQAAGGTIFLDEVGDMSPYAQAKVLRAIETKEIQRVGGTKRVPVDVRIVAATNCDLEQSVCDASFRRDLFFRLNVVRLHLPPLRERTDDIPLLCAHYIAELNQRFGCAVAGLADDVWPVLLQHTWPGNVRELKNVLEAACITTSSSHIERADLPPSLQARCTTGTEQSQDERESLLHALCVTNWNKSQAAKKLRWSRMTLYRKMMKYHIAQGTPDAASARCAASALSPARVGTTSSARSSRI